MQSCTCIRPQTGIHQTGVVPAYCRHLEGAHPEQAVDGMEVQGGGDSCGVRDLQSELGHHNLPRLVVRGVVLVWIGGEVQVLACGTHALNTKADRNENTR